jgi:phosphoglycolate phosphatase
MSESAPARSPAFSLLSGERRYDHVIWDWNGTLLDDVSFSVELANGLLDQGGLPRIDLARYRAIFDFPIRLYYERAGFDLSSDGAFERLGRAWMDAYERGRLGCPLHEGARELLTAIQSANITQSILSAYPTSSLETIVGHFGLRKHFVRVLGLDDIWARSKLELGRRWLCELSVPPSRILLVGDTLHDLEVARALGIDCALVAAGHQSSQRLRQGTPQVFDSLADLGAALGLRAGPPPREHDDAPCSRSTVGPSQG